MNGVDYDQCAGVTVTLLAPPTLTSLTPTCGPGAGGTKVRVKGEKGVDLFYRPTMTFRFGQMYMNVGGDAILDDPCSCDADFPIEGIGGCGGWRPRLCFVRSATCSSAKFVTDEMIEALGGGTDVGARKWRTCNEKPGVELRNGVYHVRVPPRLASSDVDVPVALAIDGQKFEPSELTYNYYTLSSVAPAAGPVAGGMLALRGANFDVCKPSKPRCYLAKASRATAWWRWLASSDPPRRTPCAPAAVAAAGPVRVRVGCRRRARRHFSARARPFSYSRRRWWRGRRAAQRRRRLGGLGWL